MHHRKDGFDEVRAKRRFTVAVIETGVTGKL